MQREAVEQLDLRDRSVREVAEILGKSEKTLRNQRERAKQRLRRALGEHRPRLLD
jgi:DNA-directed RNA polymerase specialized sigma24 family protein